VNFGNFGQVGPQEHHSELNMLMRRQKPDIVVCERYEKRNNDFSLLISCEYIGVVKRYCQATNTPLEMQGASEALKFCDNDKMKKLGLLLSPYIPNKDAMAARKHLVYYLIFNFGKKYSSIADRLLLELKD
jgi:hypothetical protein